MYDVVESHKVAYKSGATELAEKLEKAKDSDRVNVELLKEGTQIIYDLEKKLVQVKAERDEWKALADRLVHVMEMISNNKSHDVWPAKVAEQALEGYRVFKERKGE